MRGAAWPMLRMQVRVEQLMFWRNRSTVFFTFVLPLALLLVLGATSDPAAYVPLIATLAVISTSFQALAIQLAMHRDQGILKRIMAGPMPTWIFISGKALSICLVAIVEVAIILAFGIVAFDAPMPEMPAALLVFVLVGTATFVSLGFAFASIIPSSDAAPAMTNAAYLALILVTTLLSEVEAVPDAVRDVGSVLPLQHLFVPIQHAWIGPWSAHDWLSLLVLAGWCAACAEWTRRRFQWEPAGER